MEPRKKIGKLVPLMNAALFGLGSLSYFEGGKQVLAYASLSAAIVMLFSILFTNKKWSVYAFVMTALVALLVAFDLWYAGKKYLQYAWFAVVIANLIAAFYYNRKQHKINPPEETNAIP